MRSPAPTSLRLRRGLLAAAASTALLTAVTACQPQSSTPTPSGASMSSPPAEPAQPTPTATASADAIELPASCEDIYSPTMRAQLEADVPPLNDPGITMSSTQSEQAMQLLDSGIPTLRCTWGYPSELGVATNVSIVDPGTAGQLITALAGTGFGCDQTQGGTLCRLDETPTEDKDIAGAHGEAHFFRGNGWVTTVWLNYDPGAYTEDIAAMVWEQPAPMP